MFSFFVVRAIFVSTVWSVILFFSEKDWMWNIGLTVECDVWRRLHDNGGDSGHYYLMVKGIKAKLFHMLSKLGSIFKFNFLKF